MMRDVAFQDTSFSDSDRVFTPIQEPGNSVGVKLPSKSPGTSSGSRSSSIYYYSDTFKKQPAPTSENDVDCDMTMPVLISEKRNTRVVLDTLAGLDESQSEV